MSNVFFVFERRDIAWFNTLTPNTVELLQHHTKPVWPTVCVQPRSKSYLALISIKQGKDESLKDFMDRYNKTVRQVKEVSKEFVLNSFSTVLRVGHR